MHKCLPLYTRLLTNHHLLSSFPTVEQTEKTSPYQPIPLTSESSPPPPPPPPTYLCISGFNLQFKKPFWTSQENCRILVAKMMHMTFYWGKKVTLLFDFWRTDSWSSYAATLVACVLFSMFYQYLEDRRFRFKMMSKISNARGSIPVDSVNGANSTTPLLYSKLGIKRGQWTVAKFSGAVLFGVNSAIGYLLMLAVMSFNGGVFVAVVVGLALGYLLFRSADEDVVVVDNPCACA